MVFDSEDEREWLVAELRILRAPVDVIEWVADPATDIKALAAPEAVPFWGEVLGGVGAGGSRGAVVPPIIFGLAAEAYVEGWRADVEQSDLFEAAQVLARAARDHLNLRSHATD